MTETKINNNILQGFFVLNFGYFDFDIVSDFGFRYSNFHTFTIYPR